jgi:predicted nucleotidyltransferase component of viral defense system
VAKRTLSAQEMFDLRQLLHVATIEAIMSSNRWGPGDLVFHGGTSLHLVHQSPRFSEDLDFMVRADLDLGKIAAGVQRRMAHAPWLPVGCELSIAKAKDENRLHSFVVKIGGEQIMGSVKVKVEMWRTERRLMMSINTVVAPITGVRGGAIDRPSLVPAADLKEVWLDKVFAQGGRPYTKARDIFDMYWLTQNGIDPSLTVDLSSRFSIYDVGGPEQWLATASLRREEIISSPEQIRNDLQRWLPSFWPLTAGGVQAMIQSAVVGIDQGVLSVTAMTTALSPSG